jgi:hypothetical protein
VIATLSCPVSDASWSWEQARIEKLVEADDLLTEIGEASDEVLAAVRTGNDALIGMTVKAVYQAYLDRLTALELELDTEQVYAADAAQAVLAQAGRTA